MLMLALTLLVAADAEAVRQALIAKCEVAADRVVIDQWNDSPEKVVVIKGAAPLSDAQLDCIGQTTAELYVAESDYVLFSFEDGAIGKRYNLVSSRSSLASMGLLNRLPVFDPKRDTLRGFANRLELLCGARRASLLQIEGDNIRVRAGAFDGPPSARKDPIMCLVPALGASGFAPFGIVPPVVVRVPDLTLP